MTNVGRAMAVFSLAFTVGLLGMASPGWPQGAAEVDATRTYGTVATTFLTLSPWNFVPEDSTVTYQINRNVPGAGDTISRTNASGGIALRAGLNLPEGARVTEIGAIVCDTNSGAL